MRYQVKCSLQCRVGGCLSQSQGDGSIWKISSRVMSCHRNLQEHFFSIEKQRSAVVRVALNARYSDTTLVLRHS